MLNYIIGIYLLISLFTLVFAVKDIENIGGPKQASREFDVPVGIIRLAPFVLSLTWPVYWGVRLYAHFNFKDKKAESPENIINQMEEDF